MWGGIGGGDGGVGDEKDLSLSLLRFRALKQAQVTRLYCTGNTGLYPVQTSLEGRADVIGRPYTLFLPNLPL